MSTDELSTLRARTAELEQANEALRAQVASLQQAERRLQVTQAAVASQFSKLNALTQFSLLLAQITDTWQVGAETVRVVLETFPFHMGVAILADGHEGEGIIVDLQPRNGVENISAIDPDRLAAILRRLPSEPGLFQRDALTDDQRAWLPDLLRLIHPRDGSYDGWKTGLLMPFRARNTPLGLIWVVNMRLSFGLHHSVTPEDDELLITLFRAHVESGIENMRLQAELAAQLVHMEQARDKALDASRAKSAFLANMSHELRTPLNAVIGYSEMIMEEVEAICEDQPESADLVADFLPDLARIRGAGKHLLSVINDILDLSKIEAGKMTAHIELFDVAELLDDIRATVQPLADRNGNDVTVLLDDDVRFMRSDTTKVRQILFNLLSNACKFTQQGTVRLIAQLDQDAGQVIVTVQDTGIGMSDEQLEKVFDAFTQADSSTSREYGGTGLGLTITRHLCHLLGGDIEVDSVEGRGTTFTIRLASDLQATQQAGRDLLGSVDADGAATGLRPRASLGPTPDTVLVVDDDPVMRDLLRRVIEREGFQVATAASGSEALELATQLRPCAITLDVMMPSMDGWSLLSRLKETPDLADIPVAMVTMVAEAARGIALGADHYLVKPIDRNALVAILNTYRSGGAAAGGSGQVLLVEDDEPTRELLTRVLAADGWAVTAANNGVEALVQLEKMTPDLVLLDLMMPRMDGFEFLTHFRAKERYQAIPVVVVTAKELTADDEQRLNESVTEILAKGGGTAGDRLIDEVRRLLLRIKASARTSLPGRGSE